MSLPLVNTLRVLHVKVYPTCDYGARNSAYVIGTTSSTVVGSMSLPYKPISGTELQDMSALFETQRKTLFPFLPSAEFQY
jgi:hypothetical protein